MVKNRLEMDLDIKEEPDADTTPGNVINESAVEAEQTEENEANVLLEEIVSRESANKLDIHSCVVITENQIDGVKSTDYCDSLLSIVEKLEPLEDLNLVQSPESQEVKAAFDEDVKLDGRAIDDNTLDIATGLSGTTTDNDEQITERSKVDSEERANDEINVADKIIAHLECVAQQQQLQKDYDQKLKQLSTVLSQRDNMISLLQRESGILEKEKEALRKEATLANKEKEATVIKFAMKEKLLIDAKREKDTLEKQVSEAKKEVKNVSIRFQTLNDEKSRITHSMDDKCNELRKCQRECERLKNEIGHLESKLKYHANKLSLETEAKLALERKLEGEKNATTKLEEKANEQLKMEYEANTILLRHEIKSKDKAIEKLTNTVEMLKQLQQQLNQETAEKTELDGQLQSLKLEHERLQNNYSEELLNSAKLRVQLDDLQLLRTQNTLYEEKIHTLMDTAHNTNIKMEECEEDKEQLRRREQELLTINREMSEAIVRMQNEICLMDAKIEGFGAENELFKREKLEALSKCNDMELRLKHELQQKLSERQLLTKHLSEKTKLYEVTKIKWENCVGDLEAMKRKHTQVVKELQREIQKCKKNLEQNSQQQQQQQQQSPPLGSANPLADAVAREMCFCQYDGSPSNGAVPRNGSEQSDASLIDMAAVRGERHHNGSHSEQSSRRTSDSSEMEPAAANHAIALANVTSGPSKKALVERIVRLQQVAARQTEKIDFLENHTLSLVAELQKKSKVVQYYMLRDQAGALTSIKSDQNKSELVKYGGVMSAIYGGIKGANHASMTLELSLEINKKLQAVLEDTLLKNITLKENLDVLGLEVDKLTRKLTQSQPKE